MRARVTRGDSPRPRAGLYSAELEEIRRGWEAVLPGVDASPLLLCARIGILGRLYDLFFERLLQPFGVTRAEYETLGILRSTSSHSLHSPTELARFARQTTAGMTKTLDRLERAGLARRRPHPTDRRRIEVEITESGRILADRVFRSQIEQQRAMLAGLPASRQRQLIRDLEDVIGRLAEKVLPGEAQAPDSLRAHGRADASRQAAAARPSGSKRQRTSARRPGAPRLIRRGGHSAR